MFACLCCGYLTLEEEPPGTYDICPVCFWEDDPVQGADATVVGGANAISLAEARRSFLTLRVSDPRFRQQVRDPFPAEIPRRS
jgi:hypothetical protein